MYVGALSSTLESPPAGYAGRTRYTQLEYEALLANATIGIAYTRERRFFLCNPRFAEMFGYGPDELVGQPGDAVYPSRESYAALGAIAVPTLSAGRQLDVEWEMRRKDGSTFLCRMIAKAIDAANTQSGTVWIVEDITERRRQADELARLLREQEAILGTASIGIVFVKDRRIVRCNRRYEEMYGYGPGELDGKPTAVLYPDQDGRRVGPGLLDRNALAYTCHAVYSELREALTRVPAPPRPGVLSWLAEASVCPPSRKPTARSRKCSAAPSYRGCRSTAGSGSQHRPAARSKSRTARTTPGTRSRRDT